MKRKKTLAILIAALMLVSFGCAQKAQTPVPQTATEAPKQETVVQTVPTEVPASTDAPAATDEPAPTGSGFTVTDMAGREITIDKPVEKAVALTAADCEIIFALGAEEALVGRGAYCDYPPEVTDIPSVESGFETNIEQIIDLEPDVLFLGTMAQTQEQVEQLEKAGIKVVVSDAQTIEGTYECIRVIGEVMGKQPEADKIISDMQATFAEIEANKLDGTKSVYFETSPLQWGLYSAGKGTFMDEIAQMMGLKNIFGDVEGWPQISEEQVIERNPDYIVTVTMYNGEGPTPDEEIANRAGWQDITAVKNLDILFYPDNEFARPGPRLAEGAQMLFDFVVESLTAQELAPAA